MTVLRVTGVGVFPRFCHLRRRLRRMPIGPEIDEAEREAIAIELGGVPIIYASEFARLQAHPPAEVPRDRWDQFINDAGLFFDRWGKQAEALGWRADELFGLDPIAPMARYDRMGLIWMLRASASLRSQQQGRGCRAG